MNYELEVRREFEEFPHVFCWQHVSSLAWCGPWSMAWCVHHGDHGVAGTRVSCREHLFSLLTNDDRDIKTHSTQHLQD